MADERLRAGVAAEMALFRQNITALEERARSRLLTVEDEVVISQVLNGCRFTLDKAINAVWELYADPKPNKQKPNVYYPCQGSPEWFAEHMKRAWLDRLELKNAKTYRAIRSRQPYMGPQNAWLRDLTDLAGERHQSFVELDSSIVEETRIGEGQIGWVSEIIAFTDGTVYTDAKMFNPATGREEPLRIASELRLGHALKATGRDPVAFCRECVSRVEEVFGQLVATLPSGRGA